MTREEEIKCASKDYVNYLLDKQEYHNEDYTEDDIRQAFEKGAMFADKNPDLLSLWHDADAEPIEGSNIIILDACDIADIICYLKLSTLSGGFIDTWDRTVKYFKINKWAYVKDLSPK